MTSSRLCSARAYKLSLVAWQSCLRSSSWWVKCGSGTDTVFHRTYFLSKQMFEVSPVSSDTGAQPSTSLVDCLVNDMLLLTRPCSNQASVQISSIEYGRAVDTLLHDTLDFVVSGFRSGLFDGHFALHFGFFLRNCRWGGCVYVLQMFFCFLFSFFFVFSICHKNTRQPFSGTAERIFMKLLPNDSGENGVCIAMPKWGLGPN